MQSTPLDAPATRCALLLGTHPLQPGPMLQTEQMRADHSTGKGAPGMRLGVAFAAAFLIGQSLFAGAVLAAQTTSGQTQAASQKAPAAKQSPQTPTAKHRKKPASLHKDLAATQPAPQPDPVPPPAPPPPNWPANDQPSNAKVTWDSKGLSIVAANSSLSQILKDVSSQTGATLQGFNRDQRIFGVYGPGPARDVINQLLDGSGYNVLLIGDQGEGTPRQILLTPRAGGVSPPSRSNNPAPEEDTEVEQQAQQPEPTPPPPVQSEPVPGVPARTQQEIMQQMQERQRQLQSQQQQPQSQPNPQQ
jgi:hypothetical protein